MTRRTAILALALVVLALALRLTFALAMPNDEPDDGRMYSLMAHNVIVNGIYSNDEEPPYGATYVRVPGYPLFLAGVYRVFGDGNNTAVRVVQAFIDTATCVLVALTAAIWSPRAWTTHRRERAALAALGLAAICPFVAIYVTTILTETLACALGMLVLLSASLAMGGDDDAGAPVRAMRSPSRLWLLTGLFGGVMTMVRPESGLYVVAAGVALVLGDRPQISRVFRNGTALAVGFLVALAPWTIRNALLFETFQPLNPRSLSMPGEFVAEGYAAWLRSWIDHPRYVGPLLFTVDRDSIAIDQVPARAFDSPAERDEVAALLKRYNTPAPDADADASGQIPPTGMTPEIDAAFGEIARARAARHPLRQYVVLPAKRAIMLWFDPHADYYSFGGYLFPWANLDPDRQQQIWLPLFVAMTLAWTVAGWLGALVLWKARDARRWLLLASLVIVPRLLLLASMENPEPRYTMEFFPTVTVLAGVALARERRL